MPSSTNPAPNPLEPLFRQILSRGVREHLASYWERRRTDGESMVEFIDRLQAVGRMNVSVLKLVAREYISLDEARPLLARERFADQVGSFLRAAEPGWPAVSAAGEEPIRDDDPSETILPGRPVAAEAEEEAAAPPPPRAVEIPAAPFRRSWVDESEDDTPSASSGQQQIFRRSWADDDDYDSEPAELRIDPAPADPGHASSVPYVADDALPGFPAAESQELAFRAPPPADAGSAGDEPAAASASFAEPKEPGSTYNPYASEHPTKRFNLTEESDAAAEAATARVPASSRFSADAGARQTGQSRRYDAAAQVVGAPQPGAPAPGARMGKYVLDKLIGQGGFGSVYASTHPSLRVPVAVKVMRSDLVQGEDRATFLSEARLVAQLNHPSIVRVWDFDEDEKHRPYLVLEYVDGATLSDLLRQRGRLPAAAAIGIARDVAQGLQAAARLGIVHKDVKPANILISRDGAVKLTDFGVAALTDRRLGSLLSIHSNEGADLVCGTVDYMPPEQAQGEAVDARADMYALGVTLYQAVTGKLPFVGSTVAQVLLKQMCDDPAKPSDLVPGLSPIVSATILKMMARSPDDRYKNYAELLAALDAAAVAAAAPAAASAWSAEAQAAAPPPPPDAEMSGSVWNWLKRGARWIIKR